MRIFVRLALVLLLCPAVLTASDEKEVCPADKAAEAGQSAFEEFHNVMAPAWHTAWPEKDYEALLAAGPQFKKVFTHIVDSPLPEGSDAKKAYYVKCRDEFAELVDAYATAAEQGDKDKVYELMPELHEAFEKTAAATVRISYPQVDGLAVTIGLILNTHLPENNRNGIVGSTETLLTRLDGITEESLPSMLGWNTRDVMAEFSAMKGIAAKMKECCDSGDMESYATHAKDFNEKLKSFVATYM
jgi:hypothetical protein